MSISIPFVIRKALTRFGVAEGLFSIDEKGVLIEYQIRATLFEFIKSRVMKAHVPFQEIEEVSISKGMFVDTQIVLRANTLQSIQQIPRSSCGEAKFIIDSKYIKDVELLISDIAYQTEQKKIQKQID